MAAAVAGYCLLSIVYLLLSRMYCLPGIKLGRSCVPQVAGDTSPPELDPSAEAPTEAEACAEEDRQRQLLVEQAMHQQMDMQKQLQTQLEVSRR